MRRRDKGLDLVVETIIYLQTEGRRLARAESAKHGVSPTQLNVVKLLDEIGDLSLSELSRRLAAQNSSVTGIVDRMVQAGLVQREQSEKDRRVWRIRLTDKGQKIARTAAVAPWDVLHAAVDELSDDDQETLVGLLRKVAANVAEKLGDKP